MNIENLDKLKEYYRSVKDCMATVIDVEFFGQIKPLLSPDSIASFLNVKPVVAADLFFMRDQKQGVHIPKFRELDLEKQKHVILNCLGRLEVSDGKRVLWQLGLSS